MNLVKANGKNIFNHGLQSENNKGAQGANTLSVKEYGDGVHHITVIELDNFIVGPLAGAAAAKVLVPPTPLYTLPAGVQLCSASYANIGVEATGTAVTPDVGLGTLIGDGSENATLGDADSDMEDVLSGYAIASTATGAEVESSNVTPALLGVSADKVVYLNAAATWNADNTGNLVANGRIVFEWKTL